jgi:hypothetical protein
MSDARPLRRNASGFMQFEYNLSGKWLELIKQIAPGTTPAAVIGIPQRLPALASSP